MSIENRWSLWSDDEIDYLEWMAGQIEGETGVYEGMWSGLPRRQMEALYKRLKGKDPMTAFLRHKKRE